MNEESVHTFTGEAISCNSISAGACKTAISVRARGIWMTFVSILTLINICLISRKETVNPNNCLYVYS